MMNDEYSTILYEAADPMAGFSFKKAWRKVKEGANRAFSAATGAPRAIQHIASGEDFNSFELFADQSIGQSFKEQLTGNTIALSAVLASMGISTGFGMGSQEEEPEPVPQQTPLLQQAGSSPLAIGAALLIIGGIVYSSTKPKEYVN